MVLKLSPTVIDIIFYLAVGGLNPPSANLNFFCMFDDREDVQLRFPKASMKSSLPENYIESERQIKELKWKKEKMIEDIRREQALLDNTKVNFDRKKAEFLKFLTESSSYAAQVRALLLLLPLSTLSV